MSADQLKQDDILEIIKLFGTSPDLDRIHIKLGGAEIDLRRTGADAPVSEAPRMIAPAPAPVVAAPAPAPVAASAPAPQATAASAPETVSETAVKVTSPTLGTFYCAPEPGAEPFVKVGQRVSAGATLCIVEIMKVMNAIQAPRDGTVTQIFVRDAQSVEYGQTLMVIEP